MLEDRDIIAYLKSVAAHQFGGKREDYSIDLDNRTGSGAGIKFEIITKNNMLKGVKLERVTEPKNA